MQNKKKNKKYETSNLHEVLCAERGMVITMNERIPIRFFFITFAWAWFCWLAPMYISKLAPLGSALGTTAAFGPVAGAVICLLTFDNKEQRKRFLKSLLSLNLGWKAWLAVPIVTGGSAFLAWYIPELIGSDRPPDYLPGLTVFPAFFVFMTFLGGGQEEIGWRGYIQPRLEKKFGLLFGSLILSVIWALWHIPLWFMPHANQVYMNFFAFALGCIGLSFFFSWLMEASKNRMFSAILAHGAVNSFMALFPPIIMKADMPQPRFWLSQILLFITGTVFVMLRLRKAKS